MNIEEGLRQEVSPHIFFPKTRTTEPEKNQTSFPCVLVFGKESVGKTELISSLTGQSAAYGSNFRGATVAVERYEADGFTFVDTPGIILTSDSETTKLALEQLQSSECILLLAKATNIDHDLFDLLSLVKGKRGAIVLTHWDRVKSAGFPVDYLSSLQRRVGMPIYPVNARVLTIRDYSGILGALRSPEVFPDDYVKGKLGWKLSPEQTMLDIPFLGPAIGITGLFFPAVGAVWIANSFAGFVEPYTQSIIHPLIQLTEHLALPLRDILVGPYGLATMGPLLLVWAVPTVVLYACFLGAYKASGLIDRISDAVHPIFIKLGLSGRDMVRVIMGFGCNVPAVISTRACSGCSRDTCISTIAFGSACSYQLMATLAVFSAVGNVALVIPYLVILLTATVFFTRFVSKPIARSLNNRPLVAGTSFLGWPSVLSIWREASGNIRHFLRQALPIFLVISAIASLLDSFGVLTKMASVLSPLMAVFRLPAETALPIIMAAVRKDGILLLAETNSLTSMSPLQLITATFLAGVIVPCIVTGLTIARERTLRFAIYLFARQATAACLFAMTLSWVGKLLGY